MNYGNAPEAADAVAFLNKEFGELTDMQWQLPPDIADALMKIVARLSPAALRPTEERHKELEAAINSKLRLSRFAYKKVLDAAAEQRIVLNYHDKADILASLDYTDRTKFLQVMLRKNVSAQALSTLAEKFLPPHRTETLQAFKAAASAGAESLPILRATFAAYAFHSFHRKKILSYFSGVGEAEYCPLFYDYLKAKLPEVCTRSCGLIFWQINNYWIGQVSGQNEVRSKALTQFKQLSNKLSNHCYLAVLIKPLQQGGVSQWQMYSDLILYGEKHKSVPLKVGYFHPQKIAAQTQSYIPELNLSQCRFDLAQEGLYFKDCFVINDDSEPVNSAQEPDLLLLFEKNERDETLIPCPACRSSSVQGNSYPSLGVRSWECKNPLCPERSRSDRGNRYSLSSLIRQEAIEEVEASIPVSSLRQWKRDVVRVTAEEDVLSMLIRHYSLMNDKVSVVNFPVSSARLLGRRLTTEDPATNDNIDNFADFFDGPYFQKFCVPRPKASKAKFSNLSDIEGVEVYCGDCFDVLQQIEDGSVDGVVTSPPYYNARDYANWPNIYCFLYDQLNVAQEILRVLKPGGLFLYNIFDYFDNENNIVFSAMGNKRMILGAYAINLLERAGLRLVKNIVWDKGEIEGKRNFNQGNRSPYYQAPFNCWEHIFVFCKGAAPDFCQNLPSLLRAQPVKKMIGGRNVLGHTAPYPKSIPNLLLDSLEPCSTVLDPYAGSMTTARAAYQRGMRSINIDYKEEYCKLGVSLLVEQDIAGSQRKLF